MSEIDAVEKKIQIANDEADLQIYQDYEKNQITEIKNKIQEMKSELNKMNVREGFIRAKLE